MASKLITFGCSFTRDNYQETWADLLSQNLKLPLNNCAERGAGSDYVINRILTTEFAPGDVAAVMWPSADRIDLWADDTVPHLQGDLEYAAWLDGVEPQFVDSHGTRSSSRGYNLNGNWPRGYKDYYYKYLYSSYQSTHNLYRNIITAQLYFQHLNIPYVMMTSMDLTSPLILWKNKFDIDPVLWSRIDHTKFLDETGFVNWCLTNAMPFLNKWYPTTVSHRYYMEKFILPGARDEFGCN
jgi:hypothetical protein